MADANHICSDDPACCKFHPGCPHHATAAAPADTGEPTGTRICLLC